MIWFLTILVISYLLIFHSYVLFPLILSALSKGKKQNQIVYTLNDDLPSVAILLAVYNEESVIEEKILKTFETNYPKHKIKFYIGCRS